MSGYPKTLWVSSEYTETLRVYSEYTKTLRVYSECTKILRVCSEYTKTLRVYSEYTKTLGVYPEYTKALRVYSEHTKTLRVCSDSYWKDEVKLLVSSMSTKKNNCLHHTVIPPWIYRIPSELRSQAGLGLPSTVVGDHTGIVSAVCFFYLCEVVWWVCRAVLVGFFKNNGYFSVLRIHVVRM